MRLHAAKVSVDRLEVRVLQWREMRLDQLEGGGRDQEPERRHHPGVGREDYPVDPEHLGEPPCVHRARAPECDETVGAGILAALEAVHLRRARHVVVDDVVDAGRGPQWIEA